MIVFVGNKIKMGHLAEVLTARLGEEIIYVPEQTDIRRQENDVLIAAQNARAIVYDTQQYYNDGAELVDVIKRIFRTNKAAPILLVPTDNPNNEIVKAAISQQIRYLINCALPFGNQKEELEKILTGYYDHNINEQLADAEEVVAEEQKTLTDFVGQLYDAKQREEEKENTIIVQKKGTTQVVLDFLSGSLRTVFTIVSIILMAIAILTLLYSNTREALIENLTQIWSDICAMF